MNGLPDGATDPSHKDLTHTTAVDTLLGVVIGKCHNWYSAEGSVGQIQWKWRNQGSDTHSDI